MVKKQLLYRAAAATVLGLSLTTGVAAANPYHNNHHNNGGSSLNADLSANVSTVGVNNVTNQNAQSGPAVVNGGSNNDHHDHGDRHDGGNNNSSTGTATTGDVHNDNTTTGRVVVNQAPAPMAGSTNQGGDSHDGGNKVDVQASVNVSSVDVNNVTNQNAQSGPAAVNGNNNAGTAKTGNASNKNDTTLVVKVTQ